ncbi:MAG TPA: hypothetical protein VGE89_17380 [Bryobacteraceae bacterium]|jgi:hypothetical protein
MKRVLSMPLVAALAIAGTGLAPRGGPSDYAAHASAGQLTVAATTVSTDQVKKIFRARIDQAGYIVFEVALYPEPGSEANVYLGDFALCLGPDGTTVRAAEPGVIAAATIPDPAFGQPKLQNDANIATSTSSGHGTADIGPKGGVSASQGIGVNTYPDSPPPPNAAAKAAARDRLDQSLTSRQLPTGRITEPVAGYLYFPKPPGRARNNGFELSWSGESGQAKLTVPPAK